MDVADSGSSEGTNVQQMAFNGGGAQLWTIKKVDNGNSGYSLSPSHAPNKYLCLAEPMSDTNYNNVVISSTQFAWHIVKNRDGSYRLISETSLGRGPDITGSSNNNGASVVLYSYVGNNYQKWMFEPATTLGGAGAYRSVTSINVNCLGYALNINKYVSNAYIDMNHNDSVEAVFNKVKAYIVNDLGRECRLTTYNSLLRPNEYRIAMRVANYSETNFDYHFLVQLSNGGWAQKQGPLPSENLGSINPTTYNWSNGGISNYYNSSTLYFAVTK